MFKFSSSGGSVNYRNETERENLNSEIEIFQQNHGECASFKELFQRILEVANARQQTIETVPVYPENALILGESAADVRAVVNQLEFYQRDQDLPGYSYKQLIESAITNAISTPEIKTEIKEVPIELSENSMIIEFSDDPKRPLARKMEILQTVRSNRQKKYNLPEPETLSSVVEKLVFSEGALFNHGGDVFTGF